MVTSEDLTVSLGQSDYFSRRFLFTLNRLGVALRARTVSGRFCFLLLTRLLLALLPEVVDSSSHVACLTASFLYRGIDNHLFFWAIIVNSNVNLFFRHLGNYVDLMSSKLLVLAVRLS